MAEHAGKPKVRFAGFTEDWEQRKVGEYYDFKNGLNKGKEYFGIGTPIVNFTDVFHLRGIYEKDLKGKVSLTRAEIANFQVKMGDIFFTRTSETIDEIGFPSVMLDEPKDTVFSGFVLRGRALQDDPLTLQFKRYVFFTDAFRKEMVKKSSITTRALTSGTAIKNMEFVFPKNKKEQEFIGNFFRHLDRLITLHQRKRGRLENIKKAMLEKMFPKNGADVPEVRFAGFTEAWEQRKCKNVCSISTGKSNTQDHVENGRYPFYVRSPIVERSNRYLFDEEAVLTVGDGVGTGKVFHYINGKYDLHQRVYRMYDFSQDVSAKYFYYYFSKNFYDRVMAMTAKTSVDSVRYEMIAEMDLNLPKIQEQRQIASFFSHLDHLVTLHQRKVALLQNIKKACLEKMFV